MLRQRPDHAPLLYNNVPLQLFFYDSLWNVTTATFTMNGGCSSFSTSLPFAPKFTGLDLNERISDAVTADLKTIKSTGTVIFTNGKMTLNVAVLSDSALVRIEHVYASPDPFKNQEGDLHISQERFWKVDGIFTPGFDASATLSYNGTTASGGFLDNGLITNAEDSLALLFRSSSVAEWQVVTDATQSYQGSHTDKRGSFTTNHLRKGEYAFGIYQNNKVDSSLASGIDSCLMSSVPDVHSLIKTSIILYPNPASNSFLIRCNHVCTGCRVQVYNEIGARIYSEGLLSQEQLLPVTGWNKGIYLVVISGGDQRILATHKVIIN